MAHHQSAIKRIRQTRTRKIRNRISKKLLKSSIKAVREATTYDQAWEMLKVATKVLDRVSCKGILHKNNAAHKKSSLAKFVNSLKVAK